MPKRNGSERVAQWFRFPFNYDPLWGPDECKAKASAADEGMVIKDQPLFEVLSLLR